MSDTKALNVELPVGIPMVVNGVARFDAGRVLVRGQANNLKFKDNELSLVTATMDVQIELGRKEARLLAFEILKATDEV